MEKIKLNYGIEICNPHISYEEIKREVNTFKFEKEQELLQSNVQDVFEVIVNVTMPYKSLSL